MSDWLTEYFKRDSEPSPPARTDLSRHIPTPASPSSGNVTRRPSRSSLTTDLENLSIGMGRGLTSQLEGLKTLVTEPRQVYEGLKEFAGQVIDDPRVLAEMAREYGVKATSGPLGFGEVAGEFLSPVRGGKVPKVEIMKAPGGNWLPGSVEKFVDTVRREFITANARPAERMRQLEEAMARDPKNVNLEAPGVAREKARLEAEIPVDRWLEKKLTNYIKNDMATERDPVRLGIEQRVAKVEADRAKAEQRIAKQQEKIAEAKAAGRDTTAAEQRLEIEIADLQQKYAIDSYAAGIPTLDRDMRSIAAQNRANAPLNRDPDANILATTPQSANWEDMTDYLVDAAKAGDILGGRYPRLASAVDEAPWLAKVPPETPVYSVYRGNPEYFSHVRDELYNSLREGGDLPPELRLKADDLDKMNMDAVVAHVSKVDAWRERNRISANLAKSNNPAVFTVKQYPGTGLEWKQLKMPEIKELPEIETRQRSATQGEFRVPGDPNWYAANDMGSVSLDFEGKARDLLGTRALREALEYEGSVMGHCVGGYCDPVKAGQKQIFSLRDAKGEPHVTIEVRPRRPDMNPLDFYNSTIVPQSLVDRLSVIENENPGASFDWEQIIRESPEYKAYVGSSPPDIIQIKGKGNRKPADKYIPFVQDFVRSGNFGEIGDFFNTDLIKVRPDSPLANEFRKAGRQPPKFVTQKEMDNLEKWINVDRLSGSPLPEKFADGGVVQSASIDVSKLPTVRNPDGSVSTVRTIGIEMDGKHYLIPTVIGGRVVSNDEAIDAFKRTGRHLGVFSTREASDEAGRRLHEAEERRTGEKYDENEIERILAPLRQRLEPFFREARAVPRRVKQAAADVTEIGPIIKRSNEIPLTIFDPKSELGGEADAMRHLLFSSQLAQKYGETPAKIVSYLHEYTSPTQSEAQREMDLANDALGREIARSAKDDKQLIKLARKYVESGRAKMLPKDQRNSGY